MIIAFSVVLLVLAFLMVSGADSRRRRCGEPELGFNHIPRWWYFELYRQRYAKNIPSRDAFTFALVQSALGSSQR